MDNIRENDNQFLANNEEDEVLTKRTLSPSRINEISSKALQILIKAGFYKEDFSLQKMIESEGIKLKAYSSFSKDRLKKLQAFSTSIWQDGLCYVFPDETGKQCKFIAYNDSKSPSEILVILGHEYGHIVFKHTEQSFMGELEAICFATTIVVLLAIESQFHIGKRMAEDKNFANIIAGGTMKK